MKLTQKAVDALATDANHVEWDDETPGLGLRVQNGKKSWIVRYRVAGVQRQKSLEGKLPLKEARTRAARLRTSAHLGADIVAEDRAKTEEAKRAAEAARARSLGVIVEKYLKDAEKRLRPASYRVAKLYLDGTQKQPYWRKLHDRRADDLGRREVLDVLEEWDGRITAAQILAHLSACLSWAVERSLIERNCVSGIKPPVHQVPRERVLTDDEIKLLWAATPGDGSSSVEGHYAKILRLLLLTGQRRGEVGGIRRAELDLGRKLWRMAGDRTKNGLQHDVPLSRQALEILQAPELSSADYLFGRRGFSDWWRSKQQLDTGLQLPVWTVHDLRRTAITGMAEIGIAPHIVEAIVNHVSGHKGGIAGVYNRAKYSEEKRAALQRWADHIEMLVSGQAASNVVSIER